MDPRYPHQVVETPSHASYYDPRIAAMVHETTVVIRFMEYTFPDPAEVPALLGYMPAPVALLAPAAPPAPAVLPVAVPEVPDPVTPAVPQSPPASPVPSYHPQTYSDDEEDPSVGSYHPDPMEEDPVGETPPSSPAPSYHPGGDDDDDDDDDGDDDDDEEEEEEEDPSEGEPTVQSSVGECRPGRRILRTARQCRGGCLSRPRAAPSEEDSTYEGSTRGSCTRSAWLPCGRGGHCGRARR